MCVKSNVLLLRIITAQLKTRKLQQTCYEQADIRMRSHGLRQLVDDRPVTKLSTDLLQVGYQKFAFTGLLQVVLKSCKK